MFSTIRRSSKSYDPFSEIVTVNAVEFKSFSVQYEDMDKVYFNIFLHCTALIPNFLNRSAWDLQTSNISARFPFQVVRKSRTCPFLAVLLYCSSKSAAV